MTVHLARVHRPTFPHELQQGLSPLPHRGGPTRSLHPRVHEGLQGAGQEAVVDEDVLLDVEPRVAALQVADAIALDAVAQDQVLRARRGADRVRLHEAELVEGAFQGGRTEEAAGDGKAAQVAEGDLAHFSDSVSAANAARSGAA